MKILVISDTHLSKFDQSKFEFLKKIVSNSDRVIINGDFIEGWLISGSGFVNSGWSQLFPLLLEKETVYVRGNHEKSITQDIADCFSVKFCETYEEYIGDQNFVFEHGHRILSENKSALIKLYDWIIGLNIKLVLWSLIKFEDVLCILFPSLTEQNFFGRKQNKILNNFYNKKNFFFISSHTHTPELDIESRFANTGRIRKGHASYILINDGDVKLSKRKY